MNFLEDAMIIDENACFLCGVTGKDQVTKEHVFPKWLLSKYDIWDRKIQLLNGTFLPYRQLMIPCCKKCNSESLSDLERNISEAANADYNSVISIEAYHWFLWVGKIFYGILRKEVTLLKDRSNSSAGTIVETELLKAYSDLHYFLQGILGRHTFELNVSYSVLIVNLHNEGFYFRDNLYPGACLLKLGAIGLIVTFSDGGNVNYILNELVEKIQHEKLTEIQFNELYVRCLDISARSSPLKYMHTQVTNGGIGSTYIFNAPYVSEFDVNNYLSVMKDVFKCVDGFNDRIFDNLPQGVLPSYIFNEDGSFNKL